MPPESPTPNFLNGKSRRGSLASITSRREIDKEVLAQALDQIHTSASKSEQFTSFHDFDGRSRSGAKEIVSNGVSGLYSRLKQSVGAGTPAKELKPRPNSSASRDSVETESLRSSQQSVSRGPPNLSLKRPAPDTVSVSTASVAASPTIASAAGSNTSDLKLGSAGQSRPVERNEIEERLKDSSIRDHVQAREGQDAVADLPSQADVDRARSALLDDDRSESATQALARVLSHHEVQIDRPKAARVLQSAVSSEARSESGSIAEPTERTRFAPQAAMNKSGASLDTALKAADELLSSGGNTRPPLHHVGASHLPGFKPSRASSTTDGGDLSSSSTVQNAPQRPTLDPSPNFNSGLQRKRTNLKPLTHAAQPQHTTHVPMHLKRRVISKEFWMKDENAKDCFYCGQSFSTFRRKHHCRTCGQIFDAKCTSLVNGRPFGQPGTLRLCKPCEAMIYGSDDDSTVYSDDGEDLPLRSPLGQRSSRDFDAGNLDGPVFSRSAAEEVVTPSIGIPASRRNREAKRRSAVIEFDAHPSLARPSSSHSLISLSRRPRSSSHRRLHSKHQNLRGLRPSFDDRAPFHQNLGSENEKKSSLPAFHNDNIIDPDLAPYLSDDGSEDEQPSIMAALDAASPGDRDKLGSSGLFATAKKGRSKLGDKSIAASSMRSTKDDDATSIMSKHPKLVRKRNSSVGSVTFNRPSPRRSKSNILLKTVESDIDFRPASPMGLPNSYGSKVVRSASMHGPGAPPVELNNASLHHVRRLLDQLLSDNKMEAAAAWQKALVPILLQCTDDVIPDVQQGDDMDIRHYIKLKKVPGGKPGDTSYVSGVVFSKNIALKGMARSIRDPRIAIVTFSIEYARHQTHFMSLDPVIAQEREYLHNLVGRIAALKPQVLLVQRNVSGLALQLLADAGITVAFNIKDSVLAAVARVTQTTVIKSVDKLAIDPAHLGHCDNFEVKTYMSRGLRKTYIYLSGCPPDLGCTIVLRGTDTKMLRKIKRITEFMCYVVYNLKLETTLMRDEFVSIPSVTGDQLAAHDIRRPAGTTHEDLVPHLINAQEDDESPSYYERLEEQCRSRILSASPFVVFMQPYLLTQLREQERKLATYKKLRDQYAAADEAGDDEKQDGTDDGKFALVEPEWVHKPASKKQPKSVREYLHAVHQAQYEKTEHSYETQKRLWETFMKADSNPFDPFSHQTIIVLHSTVSSITSAPCMGPELLGISFYAGYNHVEPQFEEDCTLGQYVEDLCMSAGSTCKECGKKMSDHHRQYVHGYGQLSISVQRFPARLRGLSQAILMWSSCRLCKEETTVVPMSDDTWKYSFAKYLELTFWSSPLRPRAGVCQHDIHKDFWRCFGFQDMLVRVQYDPVDIYDVVVPRATVTWKVEADLKVKNEQYTLFLNRLNAFTESVRKRLDSINIDTVEEKKAMEAESKLEVLRQRCEDEHRDLLHKLQQRYSTSRYYELIPLNRALRMMDERAIAWDEEFNNFERDYFPSETDIRKLATLQLRNMFLESQPAGSNVNSDVSDTEDGTEVKLVTPAKDDNSRLGTTELQSEKAHDVMSSTVEEQRKSQDITAELDAASAEQAGQNEDLLGSSLGRRMSPREEQEAVDRQDVNHLDLALTSRTPEEITAEGEVDSQQNSNQSGQPESPEARRTGEPFATQPKLLGSSLLERIEMIRGKQGNGLDEPLDLPASRIPRPADSRRKDTAGLPAPPLLRAQSQPSHVSKRSIDLVSDLNIDAVVNAPPPTTTPEANPFDKRLSDRLGIGRPPVKGRLGPSMIPRSVPPSRDEPTSTSVSALAKHFEQMSREFEKERLKERRQRALRSRQARANPLASSRPIVEVYRNATEAVGERGAEDNSLKHASSAASDSLLQTIAAAEPEPTPLVSNTSSDEPQEPQEQPPPLITEEGADGAAVRQQHEHDAGGHGSPHRGRDASDPHSSITSSLVSPSSIPEMELHPELSITEQRKNVWFKYLADFWSKRSASGWSSLEYPLHSTEHVFEDSDIIVREDEPSSVIALSLACADYSNKVQDFRSHPSKSARKAAHAHTASQATANGFTTEQNEQQKAIEASLLSDTGTHMKYSFAHGPVKASCKIFYAESFDALRRRCGVADRFVESMSRCLKFDSKGGKTKSLFLKTLDNRFIIKSLQEIELKAFTKFAPDYFAFMSYTLFHGVPSVIAKMFGLFQVIIKNPNTGMDFSYYLLVMENLFYERTPNRRFDLKGSMRNRKIESTGQPDEVLLDENLVETIFESPLFVREHARKLLQASVWNDTMFLSKQNVMDYSLMAGFDDSHKELVVGIIDCIRTYTWDKKLESWIKDRGKNKPTITSPKEYRNRFRASMMQYVLQAPNCWHQFQAQMAVPKRLAEGGKPGEVQEGVMTGGEGTTAHEAGETSDGT